MLGRESHFGLQVPFSVITRPFVGSSAGDHPQGGAAHRVGFPPQESLFPKVQLREQMLSCMCCAWGLGQLLFPGSSWSTWISSRSDRGSLHRSFLAVCGNWAPTAEILQIRWSLSLRGQPAPH